MKNENYEDRLIKDLERMNNQVLANAILEAYCSEEYIRDTDGTLVPKWLELLARA